MFTGGAGEAALLSEVIGAEAVGTAIGAEAVGSALAPAIFDFAPIGANLGADAIGAAGTAMSPIAQANTASNLSNMLGNLQPGAFMNPADLPAAIQYPGSGLGPPIAETALNLAGDATATDMVSSGLLRPTIPQGMTAEAAASYFGSPGASGLPTEFANIAPAAQKDLTGIAKLLRPVLGEKTARFAEEYPYALPAAAGFMHMMNRERKAMKPPGAEPYSGPLSAFKFNPFTFRPSNITPYSRFADGGLAGTEKGMYPQSQFDKIQYAVPSQMPTSAEVIAADYEPRVNPYTGEPQYAPGGKVALSKIEDLIDEAEGTSGGIESLLSKARSDDTDALAAIEQMRQRKETDASHRKGLAATSAAAGGTMHSHLGSYSDGGRLLKGPGDGMSDSIPANIGGRQPARLADGEFVVPADVVSHLGNGSTDAGAKKLYAMMDKVRKDRTGNKKQGKEIKPEKYLPT